MKVDLGEALDDKVEEVAPLELLDVRLEAEVLEDLPRLLGEAVQVVDQVRADLPRIVEEPLEVELRG